MALIDDVDDAMLSAAEAGLAGLNPLRILRIQEIVPRAERFHLEALAAGLKNVITGPSPQTDDVESYFPVAKGFESCLVLELAPSFRKKSHVWLFM